jgi:hypothetical protein
MSANAKKRGQEKREERCNGGVLLFLNVCFEADLLGRVQVEDRISNVEIRFGRFSFNFNFSFNFAFSFALSFALSLSGIGATGVGIGGISTATDGEQAEAQQHQK